MKLNYDNQENSKRFKMYKAGKLWLVSGASIISLFGGSILMNHSVASADDTNVSTANKIVDSSSAKNTTKEESSNDIVATSAAEESENNQTNESGKKTDDVADNLTKTTDN
ncbi:MAG: KxYKxGKxW signal peptide domain-containing protein, partial [Leuconostoc falkenbergense]|uniref:KxYKxGKxW signal peptide domain-containing protein n=2 Tax=Lactobacillaceae TaxID=33958 RepID=UPI003F967771